VTDLATAIEQFAAELPKPTAEPIPVHLPAEPPKLAKVSTTWRAWWENFDFWDGNASYVDRETAFAHAALDYIAEEYPGDLFDEDPEERPKPGPLEWRAAHGSWHLIDDGRDTLVQVYEERVYGRPIPDAA
jgi:hypothetical protein